MPRPPVSQGPHWPFTDCGPALVAAAVVAALCSASSVWAQPSANRPPIYTCVDASGKKLTSDRPIRECGEVNQRILNSDGSVRRIMAPTPTAEERAEAEAREREANAERVARLDAIRRDRNLVARYPNEAAHRVGRAKALDDLRKSVANSEARVVLLNAERKKLLDEAEFYVGKALPSKVKLALDSNDASLEAQKSLILNQQSEVGRINALYDIELGRLKKLWAGMPAGTADASASPIVTTSGSR